MSRSPAAVDAALAALEAKVSLLQAPIATTADSGFEYSGGDIAWVLTSAALVFIMIPGVGYFYSGLTGRRNALSMILLSLISVAITSIQWFIWGYSLTFSDTANNPFIGNLNYAFLMNVWTQPSIGNSRIPAVVFCIYQNMFAAITPVLSLGSATERGRLLPMLIYIFVWSTLVYDPIAYWTWNPNGWSYKMGGIDYAGGTPVHIASGAAALAYAAILGKRRSHAELNKPHSLSHITLGTSLLWFGWFGFNAASGLSSDSRAAMAFIVTNISASMAGLTWLFIDYTRHSKLSAAGFCTGAIAGLVAITPASGFVSAPLSLVFGVVGAAVCNFAIQMKERFAWDDACDVFAVHGMGGITGNLLTGFFAQKTIAGLNGAVIPGGWMDQNWVQLGDQVADSVAGFAYSFGVTYIILSVMNRIPGLHLRATPEEEELGMDAAYIGELAYWHALSDASKAAATEIARQSFQNAGMSPIQPFPPGTIRKSLQTAPPVHVGQVEPIHPATTTEEKKAEPGASEPATLKVDTSH